MIPCITKLWRPSQLAEDYWVKLIAAKPAIAKAANANPDEITDYDLILKAFGGIPFGHPMLHEYLMLCWQFQWPEEIQIESQKYINTWLVRMAKACCQFKVLDAIGCASSGKTHIMGAAYGYTFWKARPFDTSVYLSTTSGEAGEARTWGAVKDLHSKDRYKIGKRLDSLQLITLDMEVKDEDGVKERDFRDVIKCVKIKPGNEGRNVVGTICGRKNKRVLWGCDEFKFMDAGVLDARVNLFANPFSQFIGLANAPREGDPAYMDAEPHGKNFPDGWRSVDRQHHTNWPTKKGHCVYFNGSNSPNYQAGEGEAVPFPRLMHRKLENEIKQVAGGEDTPIFWEQFYGFPPAVEIPDKVLTHKLLESTGSFTDPLWMDMQQKTLAGLDLGFRKDGDPCVIDFGKIGKDTRGKTILVPEKDGHKLTPSQKDQTAFEKQIARRVIEECRKRACHDLALDVTGDGGLLLQAIEAEARQQAYKLAVLAVSFSGSAEERIIVPGERRTGRDMFDRMVSQLWVGFRLCCQNGVVRGMDEHSNAVRQLCSRKYGTDDKKRFCVEKKEEMKKRIKRSPDEGDARCLLLFLALKHGLSGMDVPRIVKPVSQVVEDSQPRKMYSGNATTRYAQ
jgi:hypothetical protein